MQNLNDIFYFVKVVSHGGYAAAARAIGVQKSTLSRHIALLEERLGVTLIYRTSRQLALTDIGKDYFRQCLVVLEDAEAAQRVVDRAKEDLCGTIRIACPVSLLHYRVSDLLASFMARFPKVEIHLKCLNRWVDVIGEGYDIAIREDTGGQENGTLLIRHIGTIPQCLVANPRLLGASPPPSTPEDLAALPSLAFCFPAGGRAAGFPLLRHEWRLRDKSGTTLRVQHTPRLVTDSLPALHAALLQGLGIAQIPQPMICHDIETRRLIPLLPMFALDEQVIYAVYPSTRALAPAVRALLNHLSDTIPVFPPGAAAA